MKYVVEFNIKREFLETVEKGLLNDHIVEKHHCCTSA